MKGGEPQKFLLEQTQHADARVSWRERASAFASRHLERAIARHPSFSDVYWKQELGQISMTRIALRSKLAEGVSEDEAMELRASEILEREIHANIEKYAARDYALSQAIDALGIHAISSAAREKVLAVDVMYFLKSVLRNKERPMPEVCEVLKTKAVRAKDFPDLASMLSDALTNISQFSETQEETVGDGNILVLDDEGKGIGGAFEDVPVPEAFDVVDPVHIQASENEQGADRENERKKAREEIRKGLQLNYHRAQGAAERFVQGIASNELRRVLAVHRDEILPGFLEEIRLWTENPDLLKLQPSRQFEDAYIGALEVVGDKYSVFEQVVRDALGIRYRIAALERRVATHKLSTGTEHLVRPGIADDVSDAVLEDEMLEPDEDQEPVDRVHSWRNEFFSMLTTAKQVADRFVKHATSRVSNIDAEHAKIALAEVVTEMTGLYGFQPDHFGAHLTENALTEYVRMREGIAARAKDRHELAESETSFALSFSLLLGLRARVHAIEEILAKNELALRPPHTVLGVPKDASLEVINAAYLESLKALDPMVDSDMVRIRALHQSRDAMIRVRDSQHDSHEEVDRSSDQGHSNVSEGLAPKEHAVTRVLRAPGRMIRTLFGAAALVSAGVAVHEFAKDDSQEPSVASESQELEECATDSGDVVLSTNPQEVGAPQETVRLHALEKGETVWRVVVDLLREHHLSTSNANAMYFTHQALVDNGLTVHAAESLPIGTVLDVTHVAHMMDVAATGGDVASVPSAHAQKNERSHVAGGSVRVGVEHAPEMHAEIAPMQALTIFDPYGAEGPAYVELPSVGNPEHVMRKGESIYKLIHHSLRARGLNWTTERMNFLSQVVVDANADRFRTLVAEGTMKKMSEAWIPVGAKIDFTQAVAILDDMERAKSAGKKAKTVKDLARERGYLYPVRMKFPS